MKLIVQTPFSWAHRGVQVEHFEAGREFETEDADLIEVSTHEGWAVEPGAPAPEPAPSGAPEVAPAEAPETAEAPEPVALAKPARAKK